MLYDYWCGKCGHIILAKDMVAWREAGNADCPVCHREGHLIELIPIN